MFDPGPCVYMDKIAVGPEAADVIDINAPVKANLEAVAKALGEDVDDITAVILDRPRHDDIIRECREAGARIRLIQDGDVAGAISAAWPEQRRRHPLRHRRHARRRDRRLPRSRPWAARCSGGSGRATTKSGSAALDAGYDLDRVLTRPTTSCRARTCSSAATGISDGDLLKGVRYWGNGASTQSLVMRSKSGTIRTIDATHKWQKLMRYSAFKFD